MDYMYMHLLYPSLNPFTFTAFTFKIHVYVCMCTELTILRFLSVSFESSTLISSLVTKYSAQCQIYAYMYL